VITLTLTPEYNENLKKTYIIILGDGEESTGITSVHSVHNYAKSIIEPTCKTPGYTTYTCITCGNSYTGDYLAAQGHTEVEDAAVAATCTKEGHTKGSHCSVCNIILTAQDTVPATGHALTTVAAKAATCTATGLTEGKKCSVCGTITVAQKTVAAKGHSYKSKTTAATYTSKGYTTYTCSVCGSSYQDNETDMLKLSQPVITLANSGTGVRVNWEKITGAKGYIVYRKISGGSWKQLTTTTSLSYTDTTAISGTVYYYTVKAYAGTNKSLYVTNKTIKYLARPDVTVKNAGTGVKITWSKVTGVSGYYVYRRTENDKWTLIKNIKSASTADYTDTTAVSGTTYYYTIKAYCSSTYSAYLTNISLKYLKQPKVTLSKASNGVKVVWSRITGASGYYVYRKLPGEKWVKIKTISSGTTTGYTDVTAVSGKTYYYTVKAYSGSTFSTYVIDKTIKYVK
jgi:fibronectin type 3 domain-containing protein